MTDSFWLTVIIFEGFMWGVVIPGLLCFGMIKGMG